MGRKRGTRFSAIAFTAVIWIVAAGEARAANFVVNSAGDAGPSANTADAICDTGGPPVSGSPECTLRAAVEEADGTATGDQITFALPNPSTIALGSQLIINAPQALTITGPGAGALAVTGQDTSRILFVQAGTVTISDLTLRNGRRVGSDGTSPGGDGLPGVGGAILNTADLTIERVTLRDNQAIGGDGANGSSAPAASGGAGGGGGFAQGGAIRSEAKLTVRASRFIDNAVVSGAGGNGGNGQGVNSHGGAGGGAGEAIGGAISSLVSELRIEDSTFTGNSVTGGDGGSGGSGVSPNGMGGNGGIGGNAYGGAVALSSGFAFTSGTTFSDNDVFGGTAGAGGAGNAPGLAGPPGLGFGGAVSGFGSTWTLVNSTISGNTAPGGTGGGLLNGGGSQVNANHLTIVGNTAPSGANIGEWGVATTSLTRTIVADLSPAAGANNCSNPVASGGFNLEDANSCGFSAGTTNLFGVEPALDPLADNGGPTPTHLPAATSPVVDSISAACPPPATDQRGVTRPTGASCDIGAVEYTAPPQPPPGDTAAPDTTLTKKPKAKLKAKRKSVRATFEFAATEAGSTFECRIDAKPLAPCTSPRTVKVKKGKHRFEVAAIDTAGNRDATPAVSTFKVVRKRKRR